MKKAFVGVASAVALLAGVAVANAQTTIQGTSPTAPANQSTTAPTDQGMMNRSENATTGATHSVACAPGTNDPRCANSAGAAGNRVDPPGAAGGSGSSAGGAGSGSAGGASGGAAGGASGGASQ